MSPAEQQWLTLVLVTWTVTFAAVLAVMLRSVIRYRKQAAASPTFRAGTAVKAAWMVVPITSVVLIVVLLDSACAVLVMPASAPQAVDGA